MDPLFLLLALLALVVTSAGAIAWFIRRRRKRVAEIPRRKGPQLRHPVVLAHGILGFDELKLGPIRSKYFRGVSSRLEKLGTKVYSFKVHPTATVASRAAELAKAIELLDAERVNIVAHSMGGLDARYVASKLKLSKRIASIITVGTPHRGTPLADFGSGLWLVAPATKLLMDKGGFDAHGLLELTTERMKRFNDEVPDQEGVFYGAWLAKATFRTLNPLLLPTWQMLKLKAGDNDGLVPVSSQSWGVTCGNIEADHWGQVGWALGFDAPGFYESVVTDLIERGF
jgi:triacylglycerol lipase